MTRFPYAGIEAQVLATFLTPQDKGEAEARSQLEVIVGGIVGDCHFGHAVARKLGTREREQLGIQPLSSETMATFPDGRRDFLNWRQVTLVSRNELAELARNIAFDVRTPDDLSVLATALNANVVLDMPTHPNFPFSTMPPGTIFSFPSGAVLWNMAENVPCTGPGKKLGLKHPADFIEAAKHLRGIVAMVFAGGTIATGDTATILPRKA